MEAFRRAVAPPLCYQDEVLGGPEVAAAFSAFTEAWDEEIRVIASALHETADKVRLAKGAYQGSDHLVDTGMHGVSVHDSGPDQAGIGVPAGSSTASGAAEASRASPAFTTPGRPSALSGY
jgi:hypothetical protein